jgi:hypothetical protein
MTDANPETPFEQTPISGTMGSSSVSIPPSEMAQECLRIIEEFRRGERTSIDKAGAIRELVLALTTGMDELTSLECDDALGMYLRMLDQQSDDYALFRTQGEANDFETEENTRALPRNKRAASPEMTDESPKRQKQDENDFPWTIREQVSDGKLGDSLERMLKLLKIFARDLKLTKLSLVNSSRVPPFPHSEWSNIISGLMVDLDHVISGSFAITNDNREVKTLRGMEVKFGVAKPVKTVRMSGDWFIT